MRERARSSQAGFTLIEMMVVVTIMALLIAIGGWNYMQYQRQSGVEAAARTIRSFLNEARNNARYGKFSDNPNSACYVGNMSLADPTDGDLQYLKYDSWLEMVATNGIVLENWGVYFRNDSNYDWTQLEMKLYCRWRPKNALNYVYPQEGYRDRGLISKTADLTPGVFVLKPNPDLASEATSDHRAGIEFIPLYLGVRYPIENGKVNFGSSCYGEAINEIVIGDIDNRYLYKIPIGLAGDVGEGCFCDGVDGKLDQSCTSGKYGPTDLDAPCAVCAGEPRI